MKSLIFRPLASLVMAVIGLFNLLSPATQAAEERLPDFTFHGGMWIELSPAVVAARNFYPGNVTIGTGGVRSLTSGEALIVTNAETQLLRESVDNQDIRTIMTVTESFYRLVGKRSSGINSLADLKGKRVMVPGPTSAGYYLVAMLKTVGLTEDDVTLIPFPSGENVQEAMDRMSDALLNDEADVISIWEPEAEDAIHALGDDAIVLQDRSVYREVFNLYTTQAALDDQTKRQIVIGFVQAVIRATAALKEDPASFWPQVSEVIGYPVEDIAASWNEMEFPMYIVPDMMDILEVEEVWVAKERDRIPRPRSELEPLVDRSIMAEAMAGM